MLMSCKDFSRLVSQRQDRKLGFAERIALRLHLAICAGCENVERQMTYLREAVRQLGAGQNDPRR